jgi:hypothetical protein
LTGVKLCRSFIGFLGRKMAPDRHLVSAITFLPFPFSRAAMAGQRAVARVRLYSGADAWSRFLEGVMVGPAGFEPATKRL